MIAPHTALWIASLAALPPPVGPALARASQAPARELPGAADEAASCAPGYVPTFGAFPGVAGAGATVYATATFDDGTGSADYVAGDFIAVGGVMARNLARWDGTAVSDVGGAFFHAPIHALAVYDDGTGPALYAAGSFEYISGQPFDRIARWDGASWQPVGSGIGGTVFALTVFDDGSGPELVAGGLFVQNPGSRIASWDGTGWRALGSGLDKVVRALAVWDDGGGDRLVAGGDFLTAGGAAASRIASWDGTAWSPLGSGTNNTVWAIEAWDDGGGDALYVGGEFTLAGGAPGTVRIARFDGSSWSGLAGNVGAKVHALHAGADPGGGTALFVGGYLDPPGLPPTGIARWNGTAWSGLGSGTPGGVWSIEELDDGGQPRLLVGGSFETNPFTPQYETSNGLALWDGADWSGIASGLDGPVYALLEHDDGSGPSLFAGGRFDLGGGEPLYGIGRFDGADWHTVGGPVVSGFVYALAVADLGNGPRLFAGGSQNLMGGVQVLGIGEWDGASWSELAGGVGSAGTALAAVEFDDGSGPALIVGGSFGAWSGGPAEAIAKWDGSGWSPVGGGADNAVEALAVFDDGGGPALIAAGWFLNIGGVAAARVARWDGSSWSPLGAGLPVPVLDLEVFDDGGGAELYACAGQRVHRFTGSTWVEIGALTNPLSSEEVRFLQVYDDGSGTALFAGGDFRTIDGVNADHLARWDGVGWSPVGEGATGDVESLAVYDAGNGAGPGLVVGANVKVTGQQGLDSHLFTWTDACDPPISYCTAKPSSAGCVAAIGTSAASQPISGANDYAVGALDVQAFKPGILLAGTAGAATIPFYGGTLCLQPPWKRGPFVVAGGTASDPCSGSFSTVVNTGAVIPGGLDGGPGNSVWHQYWYRDPANGAGYLGTALSNAVRLDYR